MTLEMIWVFMLLFIPGWVAYSGIRVREAALRAGREYCQRHGLQLLDQTVSRKRTSMSRDERGNWRIWRSFGFEFTSDGERRYRGEIVTLGEQVVRIDSEAHRILH